MSKKLRPNRGSTARQHPDLNEDVNMTTNRDRHFGPRQGYLPACCIVYHYSGYVEDTNESTKTNITYCHTA